MSAADHRLGVTLRSYRLPLRAPWVSAAGTVGERRGWLLALRDGAGRVGYGECAPLPAAGTEAPELAEGWLTHWAAAADGARRSHLETALGATAAPPAVRCAIESALLDLRARAAGLPLARYLRPRAARRLRVNAAVGPLDDGVVERMEEAWLSGFRVFKVKAGVRAPADERARLAHLAGRLPGGLLRVDANGAWSREEALAMVEALNELPVESLEEPLAEPDPAFFSLLQRRARFPIALDESLSPLRGLGPGRFLAPRSVGRLVLKPPVLGGIGPALALAARARRAGVGCVVTTTLEGAAGGWLAAQLAAAVDDGLTAHGLATGGWLAEDLGAPPPVAEGTVELPAGEGLGFQPADGLC
ncbi:mandelate racemase/muconate lactonizing enzyme family protein [Endothiovibrio diazotrophicus]